MRSPLLLATLLLLLAAGLLARAGESRTLKGTVFSDLRQQIVIQAGDELYHLKKDALSPALLKKFSEAGSHEITVEVPLASIIRVRSSKEELKMPLPAH